MAIRLYSAWNSSVAARQGGGRSTLQEPNLNACRSERLELKIESIPKVISSTPSQVTAGSVPC